MNLNASDKKLSDKAEKIEFSGKLKTIEPGLILSSGRHILDIKGRRVVNYNLDEFKIVLKIFNNYVAGRKNTLILQKLVANYELHLGLKNDLIKEKNRIIEAETKRAEFNEILYLDTEKELKSQRRKAKLKAFFGVAGGAVAGLACGLLIGLFAVN